MTTRSPLADTPATDDADRALVEPVRRRVSARPSRTSSGVTRRGSTTSRSACSRTLRTPRRDAGSPHQGPHAAVVVRGPEQLPTWLYRIVVNHV